MSPITTRNGACPNRIRARCSKSSCSTGSRPGSPGSPSCASATLSARPSTISIPRSWRAMMRRKLARLMKNAGIVRNRAKIEASVTNAQAYLALESQDFSGYLWDFRRRQAACRTGSARAGKCRPRRRSPRRSPRISRSAASASAGRPSSMPSCRPAGWSTTIWWPAIAMARSRDARQDK